MLSLYNYIAHSKISGSVGRFLACNNFVNNLKNADSEKLIEAIYHTELKKQINNAGGQVLGVQTGNKTDGVLTAELLFDGKPKVLKLIIETKYAETFSSDLVRAKVLAQVVYYLKAIDISGDELPNVVFVGDNDECFVLHTNLLQQYLQNNYDWTIAPSKAGIKNIKLVDSLCNNNEIQKECYVFPIDNNFLMREVVDKIVNLVNNVKLEVRITERSISRVFDHFSMRVLKKNADGSSKCSSREQVEFFMTLVLNTDDCYRHPKKRDTAIFKNKEVSVYSDAFDALLGYYAFEYNAEDKKSFTGICDRLLEDSDRRRKGDFYTPTIWVDKAHKMLSENLGATWKDDYMIWDCACGTLNLTRDYKFIDLYCSTLIESDLKIGNKYNQEAEAKFQYDFLNDDVVLFDELLEKVKKGYKLSKKDFFGSELWYKAPNLINGMLSDKKMLFLINPPYGTGVDMRSIHSEEGLSKSGLAKTEVNSIMIKNKVGAISQQLYVQFLYRIIKLKELFCSDIAIGLVAPPLIWTGSTAKVFRATWNSFFEYIDGIIFQASSFADVADSWGISFTVFTSGKTLDATYSVRVCAVEQDVITESGVKLLYNMDAVELTCSDWVKEKTKKLKTEDNVQMKGALSFYNEPKSGKLVHEALGYYVNVSNIVNENNQNVFLVSSCAAKAHGISILPINFDRFVSNYTARRLITGAYATWINAKDEYFVPNTCNVLYYQWNADSIIYTLYNVATNVSALRNILYNEKQWDIDNNFFFMSKQEMLDLSLGKCITAFESKSNDAVYEDIQNHAKEERFVYNKLQEVALSADAQVVLGGCVVMGQKRQ